MKWGFIKRRAGVYHVIVGFYWTLARRKGGSKFVFAVKKRGSGAQMGPRPADIRRRNSRIFTTSTDEAAVVLGCSQCCHLGIEDRVLRRGSPYPSLSVGNNNII
jgi:hypothetical protein